MVAAGVANDPSDRFPGCRSRSAAAYPYTLASARADDPLTNWLGVGPTNAAQREFEALRRSFALRHQLLSSSIGIAEVTELLAAGSRQTVQDRLKAGTLLGILDQGK